MTILTIMSLGLRASLFHNIIENQVNKRWANSNELTISIESMTGHLMKTFTMKNIQILLNNGNNIVFDSVALNLNYTSLLTGKISFDKISIIGSDVSLLSENEKDTSSLIIQPIPLNILDFSFSGRLPINLNEQQEEINVELKAEVGYIDNITHIIISDFNMDDTSSVGFPLALSEAIVEISPNKIDLVHLDGNIGFIPFRGAATWNPNIPAFTGNLAIDSLLIPEKIFKKTPLNPEFSILNGEISIQSNIIKTVGILTLNNGQGLNMAGALDIKNNNGNWIVDSLSLSDGITKIAMRGGLEKNGRIYSQFILDKFDMSQWLRNVPQTNITGLALWDGDLIDGVLNNVSVSAEILETEIFIDKDISFNGTVSLRDSLLIADDPVKVTIGKGSLNVSGQANIQSREMDIVVELMNADVSLINNFWPKAFESGSATGLMKIRGTFEEPGVIADLDFTEFKYQDFTLDQLKMRAEYDNKKEKMNGAFSATFGKGVWRDEKFENGTIDLSLKNGKIILENCHFQNGEDFIQISGSSSNNSFYTLDRIQMSLHDHYLLNSEPIKIAIKDSSIDVQPFELHIDDGIMEGVISIGDRIEGHFKMSNFDANLFSLFIENPRWNASGIIFGELGFTLGANSKNIDIDLSLKRGRYLDEPFEQMNLSFFMKDGFIHADDITFIGKDNLGFHIEGILPLHSGINSKAPIFLNANFTQLKISMVTKFIPGFFDLGGKATGEIKLAGNPLKSPFNFDVQIENTRFEKIALGQLIAKGKFDGDRVSFDALSSDYNNDHIVGAGSLPIDLNYASPQIGAFFPVEQLDFHASGEFKTMDFLTTYLSEVDSVRGDIAIDLSLTGTSNHILRNGTISIANGSISTLLVKAPIANVSAYGKISNNILSLSRFKAKSVRGNEQKTKDNLSVSGSIDLASFFEPKYTLNVQGRDVYFETLPYDIKGLGNVDINISGKDTVRVAGTVEVLDGVIFQEFSFADIGAAEPVAPDEILMDYKLNFPIKGDVVFRNSQIEAELSGEISLSQIGEYDIDYGGEVTVNNGSFFYYRDEFKGLSGQVFFDNKGFNPFLDLSAYRDVADERIDIHLGGLVDDIDLTLSSSSGYSESDILELLTWGKRFEDQEFTSTGFGNQAFSLLGSILEGQLEKNLTELSGLSKLGLVDDIDISGTAGLINPDMKEDFEITAKRNLTDKTSLNVSYRRSFSLGNPNQSKVGVEYKLSRYFSVVGNMDEEGKLHLKYRYRYAY
ncbi:MAG: hypothetical protein HN657_01700 [Candidatus Marinimicrobia bacterium]|nr:hypothetical protein [Candidatus Neomarinimicrobiota bacterium]MBT3732423.1 hypothetical protein [Candidatus Neomarinimicrobiota bacterium]MBT7512905.1 hypothetical protein [Candidatus Neomarinimicrobiota bacterium]